jgi:ATP-dependent Clp protease ATP-binding subunit ClpC
LNSAIQKYLEDPVAEEILKGDVQEGDTLVADYDGKSDHLSFKVKKKKVEKSAEE